MSKFFMEPKNFCDIKIGTMFNGFNKFGRYEKFLKTYDLLCYELGTTNAVSLKGVHCSFADFDQVFLVEQSI